MQVGLTIQIKYGRSLSLYLRRLTKEGYVY
jgi:hypothetical protein